MSTVHVVPIRDAMNHLVPGGLRHAPDCEGCAGGRWLVVEALPGTDVADDACPCSPTPELVPHPDGGPDGWLYTHHSLDGREQHERPPEAEGPQP